MAKIEVLFGDFTFIEPETGLHKAIINKVDKVCYVEESDLDEVCEKGLETHESYLIPDLYKKYGEIIGNTLFPNDHIRRY